MSPNGWLFVIDLSDAFYNWRVLPQDTLWLGFYSPSRDQYGRYLFLPFGMKTSPAINDRSLKEVLRLLTKRDGVVLTDFVDDNLGAGVTEAEAWENFRAAVRFLLEAGIPVSTKPAGLKPPSQKQTWVGW
eukprot:7850765-Pyramimonas_sp.AAC.1